LSSIGGAYTRTCPPSPASMCGRQAWVQAKAARALTPMMRSKRFIMGVNARAAFACTQACLPHMLAGDGGSIINTASTLGLIGSEGFAAYGAAKAGLVKLTQQIAVEYGPTVRANVIAPGSIDTPRFRKVLQKTDGAEQWVEQLTRNIPLRRLGLAEDVAGIALFLASDLSSYMSGAILPADGGLAVYR